MEPSYTHVSRYHTDWLSNATLKAANRQLRRDDGWVTLF
jgi:hypothetical protein